MKPPSKARRRPRHAAMSDVGGSDDPRQRARSGRGLKSWDRPGSPPRGPRHHKSDSRARRRPSDGVSSAANAPASRPRPEPSSHHRHRSRDRDRDRRRSPEPTRRPADTEDLIPRFRASKDRHPEPEDRSRRRSRSRERGAHPSPSAATKRPRSRSRSPRPSRQKRSKRNHSPSRRGRDRSAEPDSTRRRRHSSPSRDHRKASPRRHGYSHRSPTRGEGSRSRRRSPSRSPARSLAGSRPVGRDSGQPRLDRPSRQSRSRSPAPEGWVSSRRPSDASRASHPRSAPSVAAGEPFADDPDGRASHRHRPSRSPRHQLDRRRWGDSPERHYSSRSDVDDDMASRGSYRGGYHPSFSHKPPYGNDPHSYSQSPQHGGSYHNSPPQSPYGGSRGGWSGPQYSPQHQYPPHYHHGGGNYGPPNGHPPQYHSNSSRSPSYSAPSGPMSQYPQGSYRSSNQGGGFHGGSFASRGASRGSNFKSGHWSSGSRGPAPRGSHPPEEGGGRRHSDASAPRNEGESNAEDAAPDENPFRPPKDLQVEDSSQNGKDEDGAMAPPNRPAPSGPASQASSTKFSFAFKPSSKPTPAAPKPEISQKFNAAPQRREPPRDFQRDPQRDPQRDFQRDSQRGPSRDSQREPPREPQRDPRREPPRERIRDNRDRDPLRGAPTEPASSRSRLDFRHPPEGPKMAPRMRKVKKIARRPKPRPSLSADLAASESVFYRKPGNESVVGSGTYGKVFKGLNVYTKGSVALKRIRMEGERDGFPVTAVREIKLLQSLRHTNIVNLQEVMVERNDCFMVFEYLSHDLTGLLNHPSFKLEPAQKKHLAKQLFEGLDYLHTRGVLHRDIKAANILVSNEGILKLADFGLARFYAKRHQLDYTNRVITIWYRSPELLLGETQYTAAVDVWSAACVMVEIFARQAIFAGDGTELGQMEKIYSILGTPNRHDWPGLVDMAWFELLRPTVKRKSMFAEKYQDKVTSEAFKLLEAMFSYDPAKRPTAAEVLQHAYFTTEEPLAQQAIQLSDIGGDWHEFESKALRKENERREREARKAAKDGGPRDKEKKRPMEAHDHQRDAKRIHVDESAAQHNEAEGATTNA